MHKELYELREVIRNTSISSNTEILSILQQIFSISEKHKYEEEK